MKATKFKSTELGAIPKDWEVKRFDECFTLMRNNTYARECLTDHSGLVANVHYGDILVKYGAVLDFVKDSIPYLKPGVKPNKDLLKDGDVIFADTAEDETAGKAVEVQGIGDRKAVAGLHTVACRPNEGLFASRYLGYYINSVAYHSQLLPLMTGTKVSSVSRAGFVSTYLALPPIAEQRRIAGALSDVDELISALGKLIEKKRNIKTGTMQQLLTGKTRLPGFKGKWMKKRLGECGKLIRDSINTQAFPNKVFFEYSMPSYDDGKIPRAVLGRNIYSNKTPIHGEVLLFNKLNVRKRRIWYVLESRPDAICSSEFLPLYSNTTDLYFLSYAVSLDECTSAFEDCSSGTSNSQKRITPDDFENYELVIPPTLAEQKAIAAVVSDMDAEIAALEADRAKYERIKSGMMQELLTGKTRLKGE